MVVARLQQGGGGPVVPTLYPRQLRRQSDLSALWLHGNAAADPELIWRAAPELQQPLRPP